MLSPSYPQRAPWGTAENLRAWQREAMEAYDLANKRDFLVAATPGAGKTTFALTMARKLRSDDVIDRVIVVAPTEHLKTQWADAAARAHIRLDPNFRNSDVSPSRQYAGVVVTYAQVAAKAYVHRQLTESGRTLVILDEVHHGGDALSWGDAVREAYAPATRRLMLSGTPFRSDDSPIPFVDYAPDTAGGMTSITDYNYGYGRALADGVVRPVLFHVYAGQMAWRTKAGEEVEAQLGQDNIKDVTSQAWRTALDPNGEWMSQILRSADARLTEIRHHVPDAGGLVLATDQTAARAYAKLLMSITGRRATVVLSDDKAASRRIEDFAGNDDRWMVAVRMVSEGVDVPRLAVGVYATSSSTPLFFAQAIGRFVRARRRGEAASVFLPHVPSLMDLAGEMERERDHVIGRGEKDGDGLDDSLLDAAEREEKASDELTEEEGKFEALSSVAHFDKVVFEGREFGQLAVPGTEEEQEFIGLPGLLEPEHVHDLLLQRTQRQSKHREVRESAERDSGQSALPEPLHRTLKEQRQLLNNLVGLYSRQTGDPHGKIHADLRRTCGGPAVAQATVAQLQKRIQSLRRRVRS
ncbi:DEAD/DEAH box helicase [Microbacterium sp. JB110]|uniref:DEAD/DEAH box helicase n=1 Tax=Microbacterium sp. JB110 TaxID=2024477 RepID=UPI00201668B4|nr:DEAD/DEAH box helicase [Microbacterium sp. JB110]